MRIGWIVKVLRLYQIYFIEKWISWCCECFQKSLPEHLFSVLHYLSLTNIQNFIIIHISNLVKCCWFSWLSYPESFIVIIFESPLLYSSQLYLRTYIFLLKSSGLPGICLLSKEAKKALEHF